MLSIRIILAFIMLMVSPVCTGVAAAQNFELVSGTTVSAGDRIEIAIDDLLPGSEVEIRAQRALKNHYAPGGPILLHAARARFRADESGRIDLTSTPSIGGSYEGIDPNGLLWSMQPVSKEPVPASDDVKLEAFVSGESVASVTFELQTQPPTFRVHEAPSLPGSYFAAHPGAGERPVIIVVAGADTLKTSREMLMPQFFAKGYSVFHFATYEIIFGSSEPTVKGLPTRYVDIAIDDLQVVHEWLAKQPNVDEDRIRLYGHSRNGAYVLLAATRFPWIKAVAAIAPSDVVWEGWGDGIQLGTTSSYSWNGKPLAYVPYSDNYFRETAKLSRGQPARLRTPMDEGRWANPDRVAAARIPIENYTGALLVAGGEQDNLWSAGHMVQNIAEHRAGASLETTLLVFPDAGHNLIGDGQNPIVLLFEDEGVRRVNARAQARTWHATLELFEDALLPAEEE